MKVGQESPKLMIRTRIQFKKGKLWNRMNKKNVLHTKNNAVGVNNIINMNVIISLNTVLNKTSIMQCICSKRAGVVTKPESAEAMGVSQQSL